VKQMSGKCKKIKSIFMISLAFMLTLGFSVPALAADPAQIITKKNPADKLVALTFDDCWNSEHLSQIIKILSDNGINGTFFAIGAAAEASPDLIKKAYLDGNEIGNHSYTHPDFTTITYAQMIDEINKCDTVIKNITGQSTKPYFRAPGFSYNSTTLQALGDAGYSKLILANIDTGDIWGYSTATITQKVLNNVSPGSIILMHTNSSAVNTPAALPGIIKSLKAQGYHFVTISKLMAAPSGVTSSSTYPGLLKYGSSGTAVKQLQQALANKGYNVSVDGAFGPGTRSAVMSFQSSMGITADGIVGSVTWGKLFTSTSTATNITLTSSTSASYQGVLKYGSGGTAVKQLQQALVNKGYKISVDGAFGPATRSAVISFQSSKGITADGIVGPVTWGKLF
jgi:peptidoglycan/xylan/chitin deacetylase (PgdA/CDA1 family)/peptidoglycan hydrolase-like protein with peptidoglycan-binding domain